MIDFLCSDDFGSPAVQLNHPVIPLHRCHISHHFCLFLSALDSTSGPRSIHLSLCHLLRVAPYLLHPSPPHQNRRCLHHDVVRPQYDGSLIGSDQVEDTSDVPFTLSSRVQAFSLCSDLVFSVLLVRMVTFLFARCYLFFFLLCLWRECPARRCRNESGNRLLSLSVRALVARSIRHYPLYVPLSC